MAKRWILLVASCAAVCVLLAGIVVTRLWTSPVSLVKQDDSAVSAVEVTRTSPGSQVRTVQLSADPVTTTVGGRQVATWAFNGQVPGPRISATVGDTIRAQVTNHLPQPLTVHWHGIAIRNDMDGVPHQTQEPIPNGGTFTYEFAVDHEGSYFYHSHVGAQLDRGLYGALVVSPPGRDATQDAVLLLDDWTDGVGRSPDDLLRQLAPSDGSGQMGGMNHGTNSGMSSMGGMGEMNHGAADPNRPLGSDTTDVDYPMYLINGRNSNEPSVVDVAPGKKVRIRLINAAASTPFRVVVGEGPMTVVATDGYPVQPVAAQSLVVGMGERYDVEVALPAGGTLPVAARVEGKSAQVVSLLRAEGAPVPRTIPVVPGLEMTPLPMAQLHAAQSSTLPTRSFDVGYDVTMSGGMMNNNWALDTPVVDGVTMPVHQGQRVRLVLINDTMMWHPMHLHGHTFQVIIPDGVGPRKDTVAVAPMSRVTVEFDADNPGQWMLHCHNIYHAEAGMMTAVSYVK